MKKFHSLLIIKSIVSQVALSSIFVCTLLLAGNIKKGYAQCTEPSLQLILPSSTSTCPGGTVALGILGQLNDATTWKVYTGSCGGTLLDSGTTSVNVNPNITTTYFIRGEGGCATPGTCLSVTISVVPVDVSTSVNSNTITANNANAAYKWLDCNNNNAVIPGEVGQNFTATSNGSYSVEVTQSGGCLPDTSNCENITVTDIIDLSATRLIRVFPNPLEDRLTIILEKGIQKNVNIVVMNALGESVYSSQNIPSEFSIDVLAWSKGVYFLKLVGTETEEIIKLIR